MARTEELSVRAGGVTLAGTLTFPDAPPPEDRRGRYPNALLLGSWLPRDRDGAWDHGGHPTWYVAEDAQPGLLRRLAEALARHGVASLRCDPRGCGDSGGDWASAGLFTRIDDARDMLAAIRSHGSLDLRRTAIVGHGEGAVSALAVAIGDPAIAALTLIGPPARSWREVQRAGVDARVASGPAGDRRHPIVEAIDRATEELIERSLRGDESFEIELPGEERVTIGLGGIEQAIHTPAVALATMLHRSCAIVHGSTDAWSVPEESALLLEALEGVGNDPVRRLVERAGHDLAEAPDELIGELAADLAARILPRDLPPVLVAIEEMG